MRTIEKKERFLTTQGEKYFIQMLHFMKRLYTFD